MSIRNVKANLGRLRSRNHPPIRLPFPVSSEMRLVQLSPGPHFARVRPLVLKQWTHLPLLRPNVVAGSLNELQLLADEVVLHSLDVSCIDHALVVLTRYGSKPLTDMMRVMLWQRFGVPIFELYLGLDESLLAWECEAHEGWHMAPGIGFANMTAGELILDGAGNSGLRTGLSGSLDQSACPCGQTSPRIMNVEPLQLFDECYLAVSA
jgi:hypothetical protein